MRPFVRMLPASVVIAGVVAGCSDAIAPTEQNQLAVAGGDDQEAVSPAGGGHLIIGWGSMTDSLSVRLTDPDGAPLEGRTVTWTTTAGTVAPAVSTTDAEGFAYTQWSLHSRSSGWAPVGTHQVQAEAGGAAPVNFIGHARAGVFIQSIAFTPEAADVQFGAAQVSVAVALTDDRRDDALELVSVQFYNPSANTTDFQSAYANLSLASGDAADGVWEGTITVPADAEHGAWFLGRIVFSWGCGGGRRATLLDAELQELGLPYHLHVGAGTTALVVDPPGWAGLAGTKDAATPKATEGC